MNTKTKARILFVSSFLLVATFMASLVSCAFESGNHLSQFVYPNSRSSSSLVFYGYMPVYADQPMDSILFGTTERWTLKTEYFGGSEDWITLPADIITPDFKIAENSIYYMGGYVQFAPNTTGHKRYARITLDAGEYSCSCGFIQLPYLAISRPLRYVINTETETSLTSRDSMLTLFANANTTVDSICFTVHADWELKVKDGTWLTPQAMQGGAGKQTVRLTFQPNMLDSDRTDSLFLSTKGKGNATDKLVVDTITVTQLKASKP